MTEPTEPVVLRLQNISKRFGSLLANDQISLDLRRGEVLALLGENGAGKTTLMSILFGHYLADGGAIEVFGQPLKMNSPRAALNAGIGMVHQHFTLADNLSVLDNITLGTEALWRVWRQRDKARQRLVELSDRFGLTVNPDVRIADLSVGERQRVEILKALYRDVKILILDEPTAVLTPQEVEGLFATLHKLTAAGLSVIFISHKLQEVMAASDRVVVLRSGRVVADVATSQTDPAQLAEAMVGRSIPPTNRPTIPSGDLLLELQNVAVAVGRSLLEAIDLTIRQHEIVGIAGVSGNGQATLFNLICGLVRPTAGSLRLHGKPLPTTPRAIAASGVARIPEDRQTTGLVPDMSIWENLILASHADPAFSRNGWLKLKTAYQHAIDLIKAYDIRCPSPDATVRLLSGGNMQKLILSRELSNQPRLVLASQPTRGLDLGAVQYVHQQLLDARSNGAGVLLISEDLEELLSLSDRLFVIYQGRLSEVRDRSTQAIGLMMLGKFP